MSDVDVDELGSHSGQPRRWGRIAAMVAGALVVAAGITAAVVVPQVMHERRVEEYTALAEELQLLMDERAQAQTTLHAATAVTYVRHSEAVSMAQAVAALGDSDEPMLPADRAQLLGETGAHAVDELGDLDDGAAPADGLHEVLTLAFLEAKAAEVTVDQAMELLATPVEPETVSTAPDEDVTDELIEQMRESIAAVQDDISVAHHDILIQDQRQEFVSETVAAMLPVLHETAAAIDDYLAAVEEQAAKAEEDVAAQTATAAAHVRDTAGSDDVAALQGRLASYVIAGEASLVSHGEVVKAEAEAEAKRKAEEEAKRKAEAAKKSSSGGSGGKMCQRFSPALFGTGGVWTMVPCR